ncbi:glycoside hydrolase, family 43 [Fimbriimonas ginsengisoli Gsoil 348]|uniref:Glycoside hydrolase, family 43 n=2 Tax=Fimbriimonas ginsengisoli TaxID=1005039 RepID=A0A068NWJ8_FIMGI|nr:glycoside hydrolase, family 43 [Fimbriimonas ginsengisoli Gsoil 348]
MAFLSLHPEQRSYWSAFPFDGFVPENGVGVHDPSICDFDGHYVCLNTNGNGFGMMRTSTDLIHWHVDGPVLPATPDWLQKAMPQHRSIWAPEAIRHGRDGLRMYYCASAAFGHNNSWIGVAECPHFNLLKPTDGWIDLGLIIDSKEGRDNFNAIDPSILVDAKGRQWMFFGSYWSGLYVAELDPTTGKLLHSDRSDMTLVARNPLDKANGIEAASAVYRDGFYYLFANYGLAAQGVRSTYQIVVGRSASPNGPFVDSQGRTMVEGGHEDVLKTSSPMFGPGGGAAFRDSKGRWLLSLHYYDGRKPWHGQVWGVPTLQVRDLLWSPDGWPLPGLPIMPESNELNRHPQKSPVGHWRHQGDFGAVSEVDIRRDGTFEIEGKRRGKWSRTGDELKLTWDPDSAFTDTVQLAYAGNYYIGRNTSNQIIRGVRVGRRSR